MADIITALVISSVSSIQIGDLEITRWSDGSVTIEDWRYPFTGDEALMHVTLEASQVQQVIAFLG